MNDQLFAKKINYMKRVGRIAALGECRKGRRARVSLGRAAQRLRAIVETSAVKRALCLRALDEAQTRALAVEANRRVLIELAK